LKNYTALISTGASHENQTRRHLSHQRCSAELRCNILRPVERRITRQRFRDCLGRRRAAELLLTKAVETASNNSNYMRVRATDHEGRPQVVEIPRATAQQLDIRPGDQLTTTPKEGGAMLEKQGKPVAFLMAPANANLTHSHELAQ
jgi:hypothetical protein